MSDKKRMYSLKTQKKKWGLFGGKSRKWLLNNHHSRKTNLYRNKMGVLTYYVLV